MKLHTVMVAKAIVCLSLGGWILVSPESLYGIFGGALNPAGSFAAREYGAALVGTLLLTWFARDADDSQARRAILAGLCVYDAIGAVVTAMAALAGTLNPLSWAVAALYLFFTAAFGYFWLARPAAVGAVSPA